MKISILIKCLNSPRDGLDSTCVNKVLLLGDRIISYCYSLKGEEFNKVLVVNGISEWFVGYETKTSPAFVDLASSSSTCDPPSQHPFEDAEPRFDEAVSTFIGDRVLACGGRVWFWNNTYSTKRDCYFLGGCNAGWKRGPDLPDPRNQAVGVMLDENRWWIAGGKLS